MRQRILIILRTPRVPACARSSVRVQADNFLFEAVDDEREAGASGGEEAWGIGDDEGGHSDGNEEEEEEFVDLDAL